MMSGEWPSVGMKGALNAAPITKVTLNIMS